MKHISDKNYCMSSFLSFRCIVDNNKEFKEGIHHYTYIPVNPEEQIACHTSEDIGKSIEEQLKNIDLSNAALLLSGGFLYAKRNTGLHSSMLCKRWN